MHAQTMHRPTVRHGEELERADQHGEIDGQSPDQAEELFGEATCDFWHAICPRAREHDVPVRRSLRIELRNIRALRGS